MSYSQSTEQRLGEEKQGVPWTAEAGEWDTPSSHCD